MEEVKVYFCPVCERYRSHPQCPTSTCRGAAAEEVVPAVAALNLLSSILDEMVSLSQNLAKATVNINHNLSKMSR